MKYFILILLLLCFSSAWAQEKQKYINVNGTSELTLTADQIDFTVQIRIVDKSVEASKKTNDEYLDELLTILKETGINSGDIEISPITLGKNYEQINRQRKQNGYFTLVNVSFVLKDLSKYYELTNKLASTDHFEINSASYSISDYEVQHKAAYVEALKAAKEKAEYMCATLGVKLREVLEIDEGTQLQSQFGLSNSGIIVNPNDMSVSGKVTIKRGVKVKFAIE